MNTSSRPHSPPPQRVRATSANDNGLGGLEHKLMPYLPTTKNPILVFISALPEEGTSTIAKKFADKLAADLEHKILLIEADAKKTTSSLSVVAAMTLGGNHLDALQTPPQGITHAVWATGTEQHRLTANFLCDAAFWEKLRAKFDMVVIDSPSLQASSDGIAFAQQADATILVVAAETTRRQVVENLCDTLKTAGAVIAGTILNKRRFHIPEHIYRKL